MKRSKLLLIPLFLLTLTVNVFADTVPYKKVCKASWYSIQSLKKEGTYQYSKGVMANGEKFNENDLTCATRMYPLGSRLRITHAASGRSCIVRVTDRIGKRFATKRIDLSKAAFMQIADLYRGLVYVRVEKI